MAKKGARRKRKKAGTEGSSPQKKRGLLIYVPAFCSVIGTLMLLSVIIAAAPLTIPQYMGYEIYNVVSGSMEPEIPIGSVIYVKPTDPTDIEKGDIIAFQSGDSVVMHRVVVNKVVEGTFTTKGDANEGGDLNEVPYADLIGIVARHVPVLGQLLILFGSTFGRICMICFAACGALLNILSGRFSDAIAYEEEQEELREQLLAEARARAEAEKKKAAEEAAAEDVQEAAAEDIEEAVAEDAKEADTEGGTPAVESLEEKESAQEKANTDGK